MNANEISSRVCHSCGVQLNSNGTVDALEGEPREHYLGCLIGDGYVPNPPAARYVTKARFMWGARREHGALTNLTPADMGLIRYALRMTAEHDYGATNRVDAKTLFDRLDDQVNQAGKS